ncbi:hypothetical protein XENORESO_012319 [Xenotaenia resolanae]|uniref:Uncharacterized protein n=1 Tax=Xenotaenia resolanae TaxID=208358 RepID=A0ABV0VQK7_9TELE
MFSGSLKQRMEEQNAVFSCCGSETKDGTSVTRGPGNQGRRKPGKEIPVADTVWRNSTYDEDHSLTEDMETQVHTVMSTMPVSTDRLRDLKTATAEDEQLSGL